MGIQINGNNDTISALDGSWTAEGATTFTGAAGFNGKVSIGGTLTYEDVTNIDAVGIITARNGIDCNGTLEVSSTSNFDGTVKVAADIEHLGDDDTKIVFTDNNIDFQAAGSSRFKVTQYANYVQTGLPLAFLASSGASPNIKSGG